MSTTLVLTVIGVIVFVLVAIAVTMQSIEKNNREKRLLESSLKAKARSFGFMLDGFPQGYLNKSLAALVANSLTDVYGQLLKLAPKNSEYQAMNERLRARIEQIATLPEETTPPTLTDSKQIKEIQQLLRSLYNYVSTMNQGGRINAAQTKSYAIQIRRLMVLSSVDGLIQASTQARGQGKYRLASHHISQAIDKMKKENHGGYFEQKIAAFQHQLTELDAHAVTRDDAKEEAGKEWDELTQEDESWKKKAIYD